MGANIHYIQLESTSVIVTDPLDRPQGYELQGGELDSGEPRVHPYIRLDISPSLHRANIHTYYAGCCRIPTEDLDSSRSLYAEELAVNIDRDDDK